MTAAPPKGAAEARPRRLHIVGGPGSGKTGLASELSTALGLPVHHLDDIVRVGGGNGPVRDALERDRLVDRILDSDAWITEGVHLIWTEPLLEHADAVIWLDYVWWPRAARRVLQRFARGAVHEMRSRPGRARFTRFGDYARQTRALVGALRETRSYYAAGTASGAALAGIEREPETLSSDSADDAGSPELTGGSRSLTAAYLSRHQAKLVHCGRSADLAELRRRWA